MIFGGGVGGVGGGCITAAALLDRTVEFLLARSAAADKAVRFRCCQLLGGMTTEYTQRPLMSEEEHDRVVDMLLPRLQDKASDYEVEDEISKSSRKGCEVFA